MSQKLNWTQQIWPKNFFTFEIFWTIFIIFFNHFYHSLTDFLKTFKLFEYFELILSLRNIPQCALRIVFTLSTMSLGQLGKWEGLFFFHKKMRVPTPNFFFCRIWFILPSGSPYISRWSFQHPWKICDEKRSSFSFYIRRQWPTFCIEYFTQRDFHEKKINQTVFPYMSWIYWQYPSLYFMEYKLLRPWAELVVKKNIIALNFFPKVFENFKKNRLII